MSRESGASCSSNRIRHNYDVVDEIMPLILFAVLSGAGRRRAANASADGFVGGEKLASGTRC